MRTFVAGLLLCMVGCAGVPSQAQIDEAERTNAWGPPPADHVRKAEQVIRKSLKDPDSMKQYACSKPEKSYLVERAEWGPGTPVWRWRVLVQYNAKNSFGGYVGLRTAFVYFDNNQPVFMQSLD